MKNEEMVFGVEVSVKVLHFNFVVVSGVADPRLLVREFNI